MNENRKTVLVTGGAGYIGSTVCAALRDAGHTPIILDSLINGRRDFTDSYKFYHGDIADRDLIYRIKCENPDLNCVIHMASLTVIPDSVKNPIEYYENNVVKSIELYKNLIDFGVNKVIFSSSASIYGSLNTGKIEEDGLIDPSNPYARTKQFNELILRDLCYASSLKCIALRYFNPIGADPHLRSGPYLENPSHVLGKIMLTVAGREPEFPITGNDFPTRDGTGIRDYVHVWDIAIAHVKAMENFTHAFDRQKNNMGFIAINLGTGSGITVREMIKKVEDIAKMKIKVVEKPRRPGDVAGGYASVDLAKELILWQPERAMGDAIHDLLKWEEKNRKS